MLQILYSKIRAHRVVLLFLISGGSAAFFQLFIYVLLSRVFSFPYLIASAVAFVSALIVSFLLQKFVTFGEGSRQRIAVQFLKFAFLALFNLGMNIMLMYAFVDGLHFFDVFSQAITMILIAIWSFFIYKLYIFKT